MTDLRTEEKWLPIAQFPGYEVSTWGRILNLRTGNIMKASQSNWGQMKISLISDVTGQRHTKSVHRLVAEAFLGQGNPIWDQVILLDGDHRNVHVWNLAWRPRPFAWKYAHQLRREQPRPYHVLPVMNVEENILYNNIIQAGMTEGLLFEDIWHSTNTGNRVFPTGAIFRVVNRV